MNIIKLSCFLSERQAGSLHRLSFLLEKKKGNFSAIFYDILGVEGGKPHGIF